MRNKRSQKTIHHTFKDPKYSARPMSEAFVNPQTKIRSGSPKNFKVGASLLNLIFLLNLRGIYAEEYQNLTLSFSFPLSTPSPFQTFSVLNGTYTNTDRSLGFDLSSSYRLGDDFIYDKELITLKKDQTAQKSKSRVQTISSKVSSEPKRKDPLQVYEDIIKEALIKGKLSTRGRAIAKAYGIELADNYQDLIEFVQTYDEMLYQFYDLRSCFHDTMILFLMCSPEFNNPEFLDQLLEKRIEVRNEYEDGINIFSPLLVFAAEFETQNPLVVKALKSKGGTLDKPITFPDLPPIVGALTSLTRSIIDNDIPKLKSLLALGANPLIPDSLGSNSFHIAVLWKNLPAINRIPFNNIERHDGNTPIDLAMNIGDSDYVKQVFAQALKLQRIEKTSPGLLDERRFSRLLNFAFENPRLDLLQEVVDSQKNQPFFASSTVNFLQIVANDSNQSDWAYRVSHRIISLHGELPLNSQDKNGDTILHRASQASNIKLAKFLIKSGANPTIQNNVGTFAFEPIQPKPTSSTPFTGQTILLGAAAGISALGALGIFCLKRPSESKKPVIIRHTQQRRQSHRLSATPISSTPKENATDTISKREESELRQFPKETLLKFLGKSAAIHELADFLDEVLYKVVPRFENKTHSQPNLIRCYINFYHQYQRSTIDSVEQQIKEALTASSPRSNLIYLKRNSNLEQFILMLQYYEKVGKAQLHDRELLEKLQLMAAFSSAPSTHSP